jgi:hypothetical protein
MDLFVSRFRALTIQVKFLFYPVQRRNVQVHNMDLSLNARHGQVRTRQTKKQIRPIQRQLHSSVKCSP